MGVFSSKQQESQGQVPQPAALPNQGRDVNMNQPLSPGLHLDWTPPPRYKTEEAEAQPWKNFYAELVKYLSKEQDLPPGVIWLGSDIPTSASSMSDDWVKGSMLGSGGNGAVYNAWRKGTDEPDVKTFALKTVPKTGMFQRERTQWSSYKTRGWSDELVQDAADKLFGLRFEVEVLYRVSTKWHLELTAVYEDDSTVYIVTPKAQGGVLTSLTKELMVNAEEWKLYDKAKLGKEHEKWIVQVDVKNARRQEHGARYAHEATFALHKMHDATDGLGIMHRDIKPDNIMLTADNHIIIIDFGLARKGPEALNDGAYTRDFCAPEQPNGETVSTKADIYAMGKVFKQLLGKIARPATNAKLGNLIAAMTAKKPENRPSAKEILLATDETLFKGKNIAFFPTLTAQQLRADALPDSIEYTGAAHKFDRGYDSSSSSDGGGAHGGYYSEDEADRDRGAEDARRLRRLRRQNASLREARQRLRGQLQAVKELIGAARELVA